MSAELRRAGPADAAAVRALARAAYAKWVPLIGREPKPMGADYDEAVARDRIDLLYVDGVLAALIQLIEEPDCLLVENVAVSPDFQGRGYGQRMMAHAETVAAELGLSKMRLYTNKAFAENIALYLKLGYQLDGEEVLANGVRVDMSKAL
jgi:GNAT superfamily N-acetyltransferase